MGFVRKNRKAKGLSVKEMAKRIDMSASGYGKLDNETSSLTMKRFVQVCNILDLDIKEAITEAIKDV